MPLKQLPPTSFVALPDTQALDHLEVALQRLSPLQRRVILLRLRDDRDIDAIAAHLALAPDAARASLAFATAQLRMMLSDRPLDRDATQWLTRCRNLLRAQAATSAAKAAPTTTTTHSTDKPAVHARRETARESLAAQFDTRQRPTFPVLQISAVLVVLAGILLMWSVWPTTPSGTSIELPPPSEPQRMPSPSAPEAPLTAPDFLLVLMRQQHPAVLEDLEFHVWLSEQENLR